MTTSDKLREIAKKYFPTEEKLSNNSLYNQLQQSSQDNLLSDLTAILEQHKEMMLEPMRKKLLSMRASKEVMDRLDAEDKLMQYGYHDCINEMLMWLKNVKK